MNSNNKLFFAVSFVLFLGLYSGFFLLPKTENFYQMMQFTKKHINLALAKGSTITIKPNELEGVGKTKVFVDREEEAIGGLEEIEQFNSSAIITKDYELVSHWPLNEGQGQIVQNIVRVDKNGEIIGGSWIDDRFLQLDYGDTINTKTTIEELGLIDDFTISFWIKPDKSLMPGYLYTVYSDAQRAPAYGVTVALDVIADSTARIRFFNNDDNKNFVHNPLDNLVELGAWSHIVVVFQKIDDDDRNLSVCVNGYCDTLRRSRDNTPDMMRNTQNIKLAGRIAGSLSLGYKGILSDVMIYSGVLPYDDIVEIYQKGLVSKMSIDNDH